MPWKQDIWQRIRDSVSAIDAAETYGFRPNSGGFIPCPFHREQQASMKLYPGDGGFHCFGCGAHGDVIDFVSRVAGISRIDAARDLNRQFSLGLEFGSEKTRRKPREYDVAGYLARLDEAIQAVHALNGPTDQTQAVRRVLQLIHQRRIAYYEEPPRHILDTGDLVLIRRYMVGNVYAVGGPSDYGQPTKEHRTVTPASKWDVWLHTIHWHGFTFGEELTALVDLAERTHAYTPLTQWKHRLDAGELDPDEIGKLTVTILEELKRFDKPDNPKL